MSVTANRRDVLRLGAAGAMLASLCPPAAQLLAAPASGPRRMPSALFPQPEGGRLVLDPAQWPRTFREAPMLAELVRRKELPPVDERIGQDPLVIAPLNGIGRYGGTLRRAFIGPSDFTTAVRFAAGPDSLLYWDYEWKQVVPNIARGFELSRDRRTLTLFLRRGMRWSDGQPFTADDVMFWYTDMYLDRRIVGSMSPALQLDGEDVIIEKVDEATVQFLAPKPYSLLPELLAGWGDLGGPSIGGRFGMGGYAPRHYLSRFHPKYRSESELTREAREAGFANWSVYFKNRNDWVLNPDLPVLSPWRVESPINQQRFTLVRNPYSIWVDTEGNQLPYIDRIRHSQCASPEVVCFKAVTGELDFQDRHLDVAKLPILLSNRTRSSYDVFLDPFEGVDLAIRINLSYKEDPEIGSLLRDADFRRALSLAVDRDAVNESFMFGMGRPSASVPLPGNKYFPGEEWVTRWARLDLDEANRLLDRLGLDRRDDEGFRLRRDGRGRLRLECLAFFAHVDFPAVGQMVRIHWRKIGVDLDVKIVDSTFAVQRGMAGTVQIALQSVNVEDPYGFPDMLFPYTSFGSGSFAGPEYARWFQSNGAAGEKPPPEIQAMMDLWRRGQTADDEERVRIGRELIRMHVDQVVTIGLVSGGLSIYGVHLARKTLGNVPRRVVNTAIVRSPANALPMTFYFKEEPRGA